MSYAQDYDDVLPPMKDAREAREMLREYVADQRVFVSAFDHKPFLPNPRLSGRALDSVYKAGYKKRQGIIAFYESATRPDDMRFILRMAKPRTYLNGQPIWSYIGPESTLWMPTVERLSHSQWTQAKKVAGLR